MTAMAVVMDRLVAGARAARDGHFNTLDAVDRQTRAAQAALAARVQAICAENPPPTVPSVPADLVTADRDARFDPEDEWELPGHVAIAGGAAAGNTPLRSARDSAGQRRDNDPDSDDDDGYPQTWLR